MNQITKNNTIQSIDRAVISMTVHLDYKGEDILTELTTELFTFFNEKTYFHKQLKTAEVVCRTANYFRMDRPENNDKVLVSGTFAKDVNSNAYSKAEKEFYDFLVQNYAKIIHSIPEFEETDTYDTYLPKIEKFFEEKGYEDLDYEERTLTTTARYLAKKGTCASQTVVRVVADLYNDKFINSSFIKSAAVIDEKDIPIYEIVVSSNQEDIKYYDGIGSDVSKEMTERYKTLVPMSQREVVIDSFEDQMAKDYFDVLFELRQDYPDFEKNTINYCGQLATSLMQNKIILEKENTEKGNETPTIIQ